MRSARLTDIPGDRASDGRLRAGNVTKPPLLSRQSLSWVSVACLALIIYGTLGPLGNTAGPWLQSTDDWSLVPPRVHSDQNDLLTNFAVYVPVGVALRLLVRRRGRAGLRDFSIAALLAIGLSYTTEVLQQFMPTRSANMTDVYVNSAAAIAGCLVAPYVQTVLRKLHAAAFLQVHLQLRCSIWTALAWIGIIIAFTLMTWPWNLRRPHWTWGFDQPLSLADPLRYGRFAAFLIVGFCAAGTSIVRGRSRGDAVRRTILRIALFSGSLEFAQAVLGEHLSSMLHALIATIAGATGAFIASLVTEPPQRVDERRLFRRGASERRVAPLLPTPMRRVLATALVLTLAFVAGKALLPDASLSNMRADPAFSWVPFRGHFGASFPTMIWDITRQVAVYFFVTAASLLLTQGRGMGAALLLLVGTIGVVELCQAFLVGHGADTTALLLAVVTWFMTTRLWRSIYPPPDRAAPVSPQAAGGASMPLEPEPDASPTTVA
jgi:VanZ family protein